MLLYLCIASFIVFGLVVITMTIRHVYRFKGEPIQFPSETQETPKN